MDITVCSASGKIKVALFFMALFFLSYLEEVLPQNPQQEIHFVDPPEYVLNGSNLELICNFEYSDNNDIARMKWEISDKTVEQRVDENGIRLTEDLLIRQSDGTFDGPGSPEVESMQLADGSFQLSVYDVNVKEDEKRYWCVASTYSIGGDEGYYDLLISVPPNPVTGIKLFVNNNTITDDKIQVSDSEPYTFKCETVGTKPAANITWSIDGETYAGSQTDEETAENLWDSVNILENLEFTKSANLQLNVFVPASDVSQRSVSLEFQGPVRVSRKTMIVIGVIGCVILAIMIPVVVCLIRYKLGYRCENCKPDDPEPTTTNVTCLLEDTHSQTKDKETKCINTEENKEDKKEEDTKDNKEEVAEDNKKDNKEEEKNEKA